MSGAALGLCRWPDDPPRPGVVQLAAAREALRAGRAEEAARILRALTADGLDDEAQRSRRNLSRDAAIRTGDRAWLDRINAEVPDPVAFADGYLIYTAYSYLRGSDLEMARATLNRVRDPRHLNERDKRRMLAIRARMEQLCGDPQAERVHVDALIDYVGRWTSPTCLGCHENPSRRGEIPTLDVAGWWGGDRLVALMKANGDAPAVRAEADRRLAANPDDHAAMLRRAYALRAEGDEAAAQAAFAAIEWAAVPGREVIPPKDILQFP